MPVATAPHWETGQSDADLLFAWMSDAGEGSDSQLRARTDALLSGGEEDVERFRVTFPRRLHELAYTEASEPGRWRVAPPGLTLIESGNEAFWTGGRTPAEERRLRAAAASAGCLAVWEPIRLAPCRIAFSGGTADIARAAAEIAVPLRTGCPERAAATLIPLERRLNGEPAPQPTNATLDSYDYATGTWEADSDRGPALRRRMRFRGTEYYVATGRGWMRAADQASAVYIGALLARVVLCVYEPEARRFIARTLLPKEFSRPLCLCTGRPPALEGASRRYEDVPPHVAAAVLHALGQDNLQEPTSARPEPRQRIHWIR